MADTSTLLIGIPGSGKTNFALTWPRPIKMFDVEGKGGDALPGRLAGVDRELFPDPIIPAALLMEAVPTKAHPHVPTVVPKELTPHAYMDFVMALNKTWQEQGKERKYETIVIDSLTAIADVSIRMHKYLEQEIGMPPTQPGYGVLGGKWLEMLNGITASLPCTNLVLVSHEDFDQDEDTKRVTYNVVCPGKMVKKQIGRFFSNVWRCSVEMRPGKGGPVATYVAQTRASGLFSMGKTKWPLMPLEVPQDYSQLLQYMK